MEQRQTQLVDIPLVGDYVVIKPVEGEEDPDEEVVVSILAERSIDAVGNVTLAYYYITNTDLINGEGYAQARGFTELEEVILE